MPTMARRDFLAICAVAPLVPLAAGCARMSYVPGLLDASGRLVVSRAEFERQPYALVDAPGLEFPVYVHQHGPEEFSAVLTRCMHRGCTVEPEGSKLVCPCHGSEYTNLGAVLRGPTQAPLVRYPVSVGGEDVIIDLGSTLR